MQSYVESTTFNGASRARRTRWAWMHAGAGVERDKDEVSIHMHYDNGRGKTLSRIEMIILSLIVWIEIVLFLRSRRSTPHSCSLLKMPLFV